MNDDDFGEWYNPDYYAKPKEDRYCFHEWVPVLLLTSTVYDCKKCGKKKEEHEVQSRG